MNKEKLEELYFGKKISRRIKEFAFVFAIIFSLIALFLIFKKDTYTFALGLFFLSIILVVLSFIKPLVLYPLWSGWMKVGLFLGGFASKIILGFAWVLMIIPISFLLKVFKKKVVNTNFTEDIESYWEDRDLSKNDFKNLENQY